MIDHHHNECGCSTISCKCACHHATKIYHAPYDVHLTHVPACVACMCVCVCVCVCVLHVHAHVHMCMCMCVHANMCVCVCVCVWRVCACLCACVHVHVSLCVFVIASRCNVANVKSLAITKRTVPKQYQKDSTCMRCLTSTGYTLRAPA